MVFGLLVSGSRAMESGCVPEAGFEAGGLSACLVSLPTCTVLCLNTIPAHCKTLMTGISRLLRITCLVNQSSQVLTHGSASKPQPASCESSPIHAQWVLGGWHGGGAGKDHR